MIVYLLTCIVNGKEYVGQSETDLETRWEKHVAVSRSTRSNAYKRMPIVRAIAKHGVENFDKKVIEECDTYESMDAAEIRWIAELGTTDPTIGYNVSKGGDAPMRGKKHRKDSIEKMREAQARVNADPETRRRKSVAASKSMLRPERRAAIKAGNTRFFENGMPEDVKQKLREAMSGERNANYGKPMPEERRIKLSTSHKGKVLTDEHKAAIALGVVGKSSARGLNRRPVHMFEDGQHIVSFLKLEFVAEDMGVSVKTMRNWLRDGKDFGDRRYVQDESTVSALRSKVR